ncbi:MAG TPA: DUF4097 family beta strand repeat-containing protein [Bacteroidota bacterium]|nr:DUF4097 family beta strand repeat-containing protein [Bacteroidota bacterium]
MNRHTMRYGILFLFIASLAGAQTKDVEERGVRSKSFSVNKGGKLEVNVRSGDIRISPWSKNEVYVQAEGIDEDDLDRLKMTQSGNRVRVEFRPRGSRWSDHARFEIHTPSEFDIELKTSGGDIEITGSINGKVTGSTAGGDITLADVGGMVEMTTSGGDIRAQEVKGNARLRTSGGDIELKAVTGEAEIGTSGGDIKVESVGKRLEAKTSGGDIQIGDVGGEVKASTAGGDVKVGKVSGGATLSTAGGNIELRGASGTVMAKTAGGDIRLENITGAIEGRTAGGDIRAELIPSGKGGSELKTAGGDIKLWIPENAKATIEAVISVEDRWGRRRSKYEIRSDFKADSYVEDEEAEEIRAKYVLNGGGELITLETANSNIEIRKLKK